MKHDLIKFCSAQSRQLLSAALVDEGTPIAHATVARIWHRFGVQPWRAQTFKFSTAPE